jgi:hypothetical protein
MFIILYYASAIILIPGIILAVIAQVRVQTTYSKYKRIKANSGWIGREMSEMLLEKAGINDVVVVPTRGTLTDNYNPQNKTLNLSEGVYASSSIAALGVAAHEIGHAIQDNENYKPLKLRAVMVPVVNIGSKFAIPLAIVGVLLTWLVENQSVGGFFLFLGIVAYSLTSIFALITLPVELNASRRAKKLLYETGVLDRRELSGASKVLTAAAWTYVASLVVSLLYLLRFMVILSSLRRRD